MARGAVVVAVLLAAACSSRGSAVSPESAGQGGSTAPLCRSGGASIHVDFPGAPPLRCSVDGNRRFSLLVGPEHAPPINPSPWYAFRYVAADGPPVRVTIRYLGARKHRYPPKLVGPDGSARPLDSKLAADGTSATVTLPGPSGIVAAQELIMPADNEALLERLAATPGGQRFMLGASVDGRPISAVRLGRSDSPRLILLLGRQHPPEVSGAIAMSAFLESLFTRASADSQFQAQFQLVAIPLLNPDGVVRGHWRANLGGVDLNRDWGQFTQPETRVVKQWLDSLPNGVRPRLMIDFHSTDRNLFYAQGEEERQCDHRFASRWLGALEGKLTDYPFAIESRNANPGLGTAKNWFCQAYSIPSLTYEVADEADRSVVRRVAADFAARLLAVLRQRDGQADD